MHIRTFFQLIIPVFFLLASCKKEKTCTGETPKPSKGNLVRIQQGVNPANDTVNLITYDPSDRIQTVVDSIYKDTMYAFYDASGRLSRIDEIKHGFSQGSAYLEKDSAQFAYNTNNLLTQYDYTIAGQKNRLIFEYTNGIVARASYYTNSGSGPYALWRYYVYQVNGGNITNIKEYTSSNVLVDEKKLTYGQQLNPFKNISLFNFANKLGTLEVINYETYFCNNIVTGYSDNTSTVVIENSFNALQKPDKIVSRYDYFTGKNFDYVFTRFFSYN